MARLEVVGPLAPHVEGYREAMRQRGHTPLTIKNLVQVFAKFDAWLLSEGVGCEGLTVETVERFGRWRQGRGEKAYITVRGLDPLIGFLRSVGAAPVPVPPERSAPAEVLLDRYRRFLIDERGLFPRSVMQCMLVAEQFIGVHDVGSLAGLTAREVRAFIDSKPADWAPFTLGHMSWSLRSLLKFLFLDGATDTALVASVPSRRSFAASGLPAPLTLQASRALVNSCDPKTAAGLRDRAMLMLMCRLGLRIGEVVRLGLDDMLWRSGEVVVAGKGGRVDRLPIPVDVGQAVVDYLRDGRSPTLCRVLFVRINAPHVGLGTAAVNSIVTLAADRAGIGHVRPHQLRYTTASQMLAGGGSLREIGQVLRHVSEATTAVYAKIDIPRLSVVARAWPQVTQ